MPVFNGFSYGRIPVVCGILARMDGRYSHSPRCWRSTATRINHIGSGISIGHSLINWRSVQLSIGWWRRGKMNVMVMSRGRKSRVRHVLLPIDWLRVDGWLTPGAIVHWTWSSWIITSVLGNLRLHYIKQYIITFIGYRKEKKKTLIRKTYLSFGF